MALNKRVNVNNTRKHEMTPVLSRMHQRRFRLILIIFNFWLWVKWWFQIQATLTNYLEMTIHYRTLVFYDVEKNGGNLAAHNLRRNKSSAFQVF